MPSKVIEIKGGKAVVEPCHHQVDLTLVKDVKVGDYLLVHDNLALNKVPKSDAKKILSMINELSR